jgi:hypothetical protein
MGQMLHQEDEHGHSGGWRKTLTWYPAHEGKKQADAHLGVAACILSAPLAQLYA